MTPLSVVRASAPAAPPPTAGGERAGAPGFAALLEAAREPTAPVVAAQGDAPAADTPTAQDPGDVRAAPPKRKLPAPAAHVQRDRARDEAPPALDIAALLQDKAAQVECAAAADAAPPDAFDEPLARPATGTVVPPQVLPMPPVNVERTPGEMAPDARTGAAQPRAEREPAAVDAIPQAVLDAPAITPAPAPTEPSGLAMAEAAPSHAETAEVHRGTSTPSAPDTLPAAAPFTAAPGSAAAAAAPASSAEHFSAHLAAALNAPAFAPALATQVRWWVEGGVQTAQLTLNPAEMGPVAVRIAVEGTQARIDFAADLAPTRAALESSLPTLAAALAEGGLMLAGGGVFDGSSARQPHPDGQPRARAATAGGAGTPGTAVTAASPVLHARGLVDLVA